MEYWLVGKYGGDAAAAEMTKWQYARLKDFTEWLLKGIVGSERNFDLVLWNEQRAREAKEMEEEGRERERQMDKRASPKTVGDVNMIEPITVEWRFRTKKDGRVKSKGVAFGQKVMTPEGSHTPKKQEINKKEKAEPITEESHTPKKQEISKKEITETTTREMRRLIDKGVFEEVRRELHEEMEMEIDKMDQKVLVYNEVGKQRIESIHKSDKKIIGETKEKEEGKSEKKDFVGAVVINKTNSRVKRCRIDQKKKEGKGERIKRGRRARINIAEGTQKNRRRQSEMRLEISVLRNRQEAMLWE